jgi:hypothetical protein
LIPLTPNKNEEESGYEKVKDSGIASNPTHNPYINVVVEVKN